MVFGEKINEASFRIPHVDDGVAAKPGTVWMEASENLVNRDLQAALFDAMPEAEL